MDMKLGFLTVAEERAPSVTVPVVPPTRVVIVVETTFLIFESSVK